MEKKALTYIQNALGQKVPDRFYLKHDYNTSNDLMIEEMNIGEVWEK